MQTAVSALSWGALGVVLLVGVAWAVKLCLEHPKATIGAAVVYSMIDRRRSIRGTVQGIGAGVLDAERINLPRNLPFVQKSMNWVHVAQRFPVRVQLEDAPAPLLRLGASAVVEVRHGDACR